MSAEHIIVVSLLAIGIGAAIYIVASAAGGICLLRGHRLAYGTDVTDSVHGRDCMRCGERQRWWSKSALLRHGGFLNDDRPEDMKAAGRLRSERQ